MKIKTLKLFTLSFALLFFYTNTYTIKADDEIQINENKSTAGNLEQPKSQTKFEETIPYYAFVGLGEDNLSKENNKSFRNDFYKYDPNNDKWAKLNTFTGGSRTSAISYVQNNIAYVGCGLDEGDPSNGIYERFRNDIYKYDFEKDTWIGASIFQKSLRKKMVTFIYKNDAFVGLGHFGAKKFYDTYKYDLSTNEWVKSYEFDPKISPIAILSFKNKLYLIGKDNTFFSFDPEKQESKKLETIPEGCNKKIFFVANKKIYLGFGGPQFEATKQTNKKAKNKDKQKIVDNSFYCYNDIENKWETLKPFPGKIRKGCIIFAIKDIIYVGLGVDSNGHYSNEFYKYDTKVNEWTKMTDFPGKPRKNAVAFVLKIMQ